MKQKMILVVSTGILCCCLQIWVRAQSLPKSIAPYPIAVSDNKTSNLIFPSSIKSVDRGSSDVLAQKATGIENILQLKGAEPNFKETNVTVITADGKFYSFEVRYNNTPSTLNFSFVGDSSEKALIKDQPVSEATLLNTANLIKNKRHSLHKRTREEGTELSLLNLFVGDGLLWIELRITSQSLVPFTPAYTRFFLQDKKASKRTATQEVERVPVYHSPLEKAEKGKAYVNVFAFTPFTVPQGKEWVIQIGENDRSRSLSLHINHRIMQKTKSL